MSPRLFRWAIAALAGLALAGPAQAQYSYGKAGRYGAAGEGGFILFVEAALAAPRNVDNVVATEIDGSTITPIIPVWNEDPAGRVGFGYEWDSGSSLVLSYWTFETDVAAVESATSGFLAFAIGPPVASGGDFFGDAGAPGFLDVTTEIRAETLDLAWAGTQELSDAFSMRWSLGLRYASYEETHTGLYDEAGGPAGVNSFAVSKSLQGDMLGAKVAARGTYRFGPFSISSGLGVSLLDGKLEAFSSLEPDGTGNGGLPPSAGSSFDDGRSGTIRDFDVEGSWHLASERLRLSLGWEQSEWREIAADPLRNFPGTVIPLQEREAVVFSGVRLGLHLRF